MRSSYLPYRPIGFALGGLRLLGLLAYAALSNCLPPSRLPAVAQAQLQSTWENQQVELRQSAYYTNLYADNDRWLLSPHPPESTSHLVDLHGAPIHPPKARGIVPAGSRFCILRLEFPSRWNGWKRLVVSPRFHPWVYLRLLPGQDPALGRPRPDQPFVWVLPLDQDRPQPLQEALAEAFSPLGTTTEWLRTRRPTVQVGIAQKTALIGMQRPELIAALGEPPRQFADRLGDKPAEVAWYAELEAWIVDQQVVALKPPRPLDPAR
jgi:hypothetical protein